MRKFLWKPDPPKAKDWDASPKLRVRGPLPTKVLLRHLILSVLDQANLGSCVANAIFQAVRAALVRAGVVGAQLGSRLWGYYFGRAQTGNTQADEGTYLRAVFDVIRKLGYPLEALWPYDDGPDKFRQMPSSAAVRAAYDQKTSVGYYRINSSDQQRVEDVKAALAAGYLVVFGTQVSNLFEAYAASSPPLTVPGKSEVILGGHALTIVGYEVLPDGATIFEVLNSWGDFYGDHGYCKFTSEYVAWSESQDFWIVEAMPDFSEK